MNSYITKKEGGLGNSSRGGFGYMNNLDINESNEKCDPESSNEHNQNGRCSSVMSSISSGSSHSTLSSSNGLNKSKTILIASDSELEDKHNKSNLMSLLKSQESKSDSENITSKWINSSSKQQLINNSNNINNNESSDVKKYKIKSKSSILSQQSTDATSPGATGATLQSSPTHLCKDCLRTFKDVNNYKEHRFQEHQVTEFPNIRQCKMCSYATLLKSKYDCHMRCHLNNKVIKCQRCDYSTINIRHMSRHERMHMIKNTQTLKQQLPLVVDSLTKVNEKNLNSSLTQIYPLENKNHLSLKKTKSLKNLRQISTNESMNKEEEQHEENNFYLNNDKMTTAIRKRKLSNTEIVASNNGKTNEQDSMQHNYYRHDSIDSQPTDLTSPSRQCSIKCDKEHSKNFQHNLPNLSPKLSNDSSKDLVLIEEEENSTFNKSKPSEKYNLPQVSGYNNDEYNLGPRNENDLNNNNNNNINSNSKLIEYNLLINSLNQYEELRRKTYDKEAKHFYKTGDFKLKASISNPIIINSGPSQSSSLSSSPSSSSHHLINKEDSSKKFKIDQNNNNNNNNPSCVQFHCPEIKYPQNQDLSNENKSSASNNMVYTKTNIKLSESLPIYHSSNLMTPPSSASSRSSLAASPIERKPVDTNSISSYYIKNATNTFQNILNLINNCSSTSQNNSIPTNDLNMFNGANASYLAPPPPPPPQPMSLPLSQYHQQQILSQNMNQSYRTRLEDIIKLNPNVNFNAANASLIYNLISNELKLNKQFTESFNKQINNNFGLENSNNNHHQLNNMNDMVSVGNHRQPNCDCSNDKPCQFSQTYENQNLNEQFKQTQIQANNQQQQQQQQHNHRHHHQHHHHQEINLNETNSNHSSYVSDEFQSDCNNNCKALCNHKLELEYLRKNIFKLLNSLVPQIISFSRLNENSIEGSNQIDKLIDSLLNQLNLS